MKRKKSLPLSVFKILSLLIPLFFSVEGFCADYDTALRADLNFNYTINDKFKSVSYVFIQLNDDVENFNYSEWGTGLQYQTLLNGFPSLFFISKAIQKTITAAGIWNRGPA